MLANLWFFYALSAAMLWGISYIIAEKVMEAGLTPAFLMFIGTLITLPFYLGLAWIFGHIKPGFDIILAPENKNIFWQLIFADFAALGGSFLILMSVSQKNATMASLIEISYPLFTLFFAWAIFREVQINLAGVIGAVLIFAGISLIYLKG